jgi:hypothetical protein
MKLGTNRPNSKKVARKEGPGAMEGCRHGGEFRERKVMVVVDDEKGDEYEERKKERAKNQQHGARAFVSLAPFPGDT